MVVVAPTLHPETSISLKWATRMPGPLAGVVLACSSYQEGEASARSVAAVIHTIKPIADFEFFTQA